MIIFVPGYTGEDIKWYHAFLFLFLGLFDMVTSPEFWRFAIPWFVVMFAVITIITWF